MSNLTTWICSRVEKLTSDYGAAFTRADGLKILGLEQPNDAQALADLMDSALSVHDAIGSDDQPPQGILKAEAVDRLATEAKIAETKDAIERTTDDTTKNELEARLRELEAAAQAGF